MLSGCEKVLCQLFNSGFKALRWHMFKKLKGHQSVEKLLPNSGMHFYWMHFFRDALLLDFIGSKELAVLYESYSTATFVIQHSFVRYR